MSLDLDKLITITNRNDIVLGQQYILADSLADLEPPAYIRRVTETHVREYPFTDESNTNWRYAYPLDVILKQYFDEWSTSLEGEAGLYDAYKAGYLAR